MTDPTLAAVQHHLESATRLLEKFLKQTPGAATNGPKPGWKRPNDRLTDEGVAAMRDMFVAGMKDADIARQFRVSSTAVHNQRNKWIAETHSTRRRRT